MRKILIMMALMLTLSVAANAKDIHRLVVKSERMHCGKCASRVTTGLMKVDGVKTVETDLSTHAITVYYDNAKVGEEKLMATLTEIGCAAVKESDSKVKKAPKMKVKKGEVAACSEGKCEEEKAGKQSEKKVDGTTGATKKN